MKANDMDHDFWLLTWPDSEIAGLTQAGETLRIRFTVVSVSRPGSPAGYLSDVELICRLAAPLICVDASGASLPLDEFLGGIAEGTILDNGQLMRLLELPSARHGELHLDFRLISGSTLALHASSLQAIVPTSAVFRESWAC